MRELKEMLLRDLGGRIALSSRWPLVVDPESIAHRSSSSGSDQPKTYSRRRPRYSGSSLLNFFYPGDPELKRVTQSLIDHLYLGY